MKKFFLETRFVSFILETRIVSFILGHQRMDAEEFRRFGKQMVDYVADYLENIRDRKPFPDVSPGYLKELIPDKAPDEAEQWPDVMKDIERVIMPGVR